MIFTTYRNISIWLTLFLFGFPPVFQGQEQWTMDQFLLKAMDTPAAELQSQKIELLDNGQWSLPLFERLEFRTETNKFDLNKQDYALRINTNSFSEIAKQNKLQKTRKAIQELHQSVLLKTEMVNRYQIIISKKFLEDQLHLTKKKRKLLKEKQEVLEAMAGWDDIKINLLIDTEDDLLKNKLEILELEQSLASLQQTIDVLCGGNTTINTEDIIAARFIREHYQDILKQDSIQTDEVLKLQLQLEQNKDKLDLQNASRKKLVKFYQMKYRADPNGYQQEQFSLGIGLLIPIKGSGRIDETQNKMTALELQSDLNQELDKMKIQQLEVIYQLEGAIERYELLAEHQTKSLTLKALNNYSNTPDISALSILSLRAQDLKYQEQTLAADFDLYKIYIESLEAFDLVSIKPFQNYLSSNHFGY